jgi:hypothetical protein
VLYSAARLKSITEDIIAEHLDFSLIGLFQKGQVEAAIYIEAKNIGTGHLDHIA